MTTQQTLTTADSTAADSTIGYSTSIKPKTLISIQSVSKRFRSQEQKGRSFQEIFVNLLNKKNENQKDFLWSLRNISFDVHAGDCVGLIGPNGSGKSTLLKVISGIIEPTYGQVTVNGRISSLLELGAGFHPDLTGRENIYLNGSIYGLTRKDMNRRLDEIISFSELEDFIDMPVKHYSSGMYVRLGFAVAINTEPDLLLIDEVLAVGDANFQRKCLDVIYRFRARGGTLLLVTHDLATVQSMCNRAVWFDEGQVQNIGHPTDVVMSYMQRIAEDENKARQLLRESRQEVDEELDSEGLDSEGLDSEGLDSEELDDAVDDDSLADDSQEESIVVLSEDASSDELQEEDEPVEEEVEEEEEVKRQWGTGEIEITDVEFLNAEGMISFVFQTGDFMEIRIHYEAENPVDEPIFGLAVYRQDNTHICGPNTKFGNLHVPRVSGKGYVSYKIPELSLLEGSFLLTLAIIDQSDTITYDFMDRLYTFSVYPGKTQERYGMVTLLGEWEWQEGEQMPSSDDHLLADDDLLVMDLEEGEMLTDDLKEMAMLESLATEEASPVAA